MSSYLRLSRSLYSDARRVFRIKSIVGKSAQNTYLRTQMALQQIRDCYSIDWAGQRLLEVGCGQKLAYTLSFGQQNRVVGIDTELPLHRPYMKNMLDLFKFSGAYRAFKSVIAEVCCMQRGFRRAMNRLTGFSGRYDVELARMDATSLTFPGEYFDGVFSFSVFEHISDPRQALLEARRVLKPNGVLYLDLHLFTSVHGDHDFRPASPMWNHLRPSCFAGRVESCYCNKIRLEQWKTMLQEIFDSVHFIRIPGEIDTNKSYLTGDIREELEGYSEDELVMTSFIAVAKKA